MPGINGTDGEPGFNGSDGIPGIPGFNGSQGPLGAPGPQVTLIRLFWIINLNIDAYVRTYL